MVGELGRGTCLAAAGAPRNWPIAANSSARVGAAGMTARLTALAPRPAARAATPAPGSGMAAEAAPSAMPWAEPTAEPATGAPMSDRARWPFAYWAPTADEPPLPPRLARSAWPERRRSAPYRSMLRNVSYQLFPWGLIGAALAAWIEFSRAAALLARDDAMPPIPAPGTGRLGSDLPIVDGAATDFPIGLAGGPAIRLPRPPTSSLAWPRPTAAWPMPIRAARPTVWSNAVPMPVPIEPRPPRTAPIQSPGPAYLIRVSMPRDSDRICEAIAG